MDRFVEPALVLSTVDYGEADRVVTLLTRGRGRLTAFANGARKSKRRFAGALEPGTHLNAQLVERQGDTFRLDGAEVVQSFFRVQEDLNRISRFLYCLELVRELTRDAEPHPELFDALKGYLELLELKRAGPTSLIAFELQALSLAGFRPRFFPCSACGLEIGDEPRFDPDAGGVLCPGCAMNVPFSLPVARHVVKALAQLQAGARVPLEPELRARCRELLNLFIAHHLGRKLKSADFMNQVGID